MEECNRYNIACRVMRLLTFIDLPIKKKFRLFSFGVLFWFLLMASLTVVGMIGISTRYDKIINNAVPQDKVVQKAIRKLQSMNIDASGVLQTQDAGTVDRLYDLSTRRLRDLRDFSSALALGGAVNDYSHDTGKLLETLHTTSLNEDPEGVKFLKEFSPLLDDIDQAYSDFYAYKLLALSTEGQQKTLDAQFAALENRLSAASQLAIDFSLYLSDLYHSSASRILEIIQVTVLTVVGVLLIAVLLLLLFTRWISRALAKPINDIVEQIHSVGTGDVDLTNKIEITSRDEIGTLSQEFNSLMDTVYSMTMFKRVIEEDATLEDVYARIGEVFHREIGLDDFVIYEVKDNQREMVPVYPMAFGAGEMSCSAEILTNCDLCRAKKTGHEISSVSYPQVCKQFKQEVDKTHVCMPMIIGGRTGGVVQFLFESREGDTLDVQAVQGKIFKAEAYIKQALSVIEAKRLMNTLRESALKDPLTGLYNRRFLQDHATHVISGVLRRKTCLGMIMCDLDYFKQVNDEYGHDVGDLVLKETSQLIYKGIRDTDIVIRFGGEEFLVLLVDTKPGDAQVVAEKIRTNFEEFKFKIPNGSLKKTLSLGVSEFPVDSEGFWQCIKYADVALYKAKEGGRNQSLRFEESMWEGEQF